MGIFPSSVSGREITYEASGDCVKVVSKIKQERPLLSIYDSWTVEENLDNGYARCRCVCGAVRAVQVRQLREKRSRSCGCMTGTYRREVKALEQQKKFKAPIKYE